MNASALAQTAYGVRQQGVRSSRETEYQAFARVTGALDAAVKADDYPMLAAALYDNNRLWTVLAADVASDGNQFPKTLRGQILNLAMFTMRTSQKVLQGDEEPAVLIEINHIIMRGLRGDAVTTQ